MRVGPRAGALLFALALAVRLAAIGARGFSTAQFADAPAYLRAARSLAETGQYPLRTDPHYFRPPGYPVFLAVATLGHPDSIAIDKVYNAVLGAAAVLLLAGLSARIFRSRRLAVATGVLAALDPSLVLVSSDVQSEPLFLALLLSAGFLLLVCVDRPSSNFGVLAGGLLGLAALTRPSALGVAPLLLAPLLDRRYPLRVRSHLAASALLGLALTLLPWTVRNALRLHQFVLVSDFGGINFAVGNSESMLRLCGLRTREEYQEWGRQIERQVDAVVEDLRASGVPPQALTRALVSRTVSERWKDPAGTVRLLACKARDWLRPYPNPAFWPTAAVWGVGAFYAALFVLAARGLWEASRRGTSRFALGFLVVTMAIHVATVVAWRYRAVYWDPVLLLYGVRGASGRG